LAQATLDIRAGEVHALVGENGAGKSTLARIIAGLETYDAGQMILTGESYRPQGRRDAEALGVRMVMQELNLIPTLSVAENVFIEGLPHHFGFVDYRALNAAARDVMAQVGLDRIDPAQPVAALGVGQQQMVEIAAGLSRRCRVLVLDEPTASLTDSEVNLLFEQIAKLKAQGVGIVYISHRIEEILHLAERVTVLRDGKVIATCAARDLSQDDIIRMMVGRDLTEEDFAPAEARGDLALRVVGLRGDNVHDVSFDAYRGEILGVAGLMGSGRTETMRMIFGADRREAGDIYLDGSDRPAQIRTPRDAVRQGIALLTEDRKGQGLLLPLSVRENISIARLGEVSRLGWICSRTERATAKRYVGSLDVRCRSTEQAAGQLSGGNQQKVVIAKWLFRDCDILIFDEPTRGIDIGAKFEIYRMLATLAREGRSIIFISSDLRELTAICSRIMVLSAGTVASVFERGQWSEESIMSAAFSGYAAPR
jgi:ribose transport system ATP-binding protein